MAGRYVPPHLRKRNGSEATQVDAVASSKPPRQSNPRLSVEDIHDHFWPVSEDVLGDNRPKVSYYSQSKTLHDSRETPGKLAFVLLFHDKGIPANPRWEEDQIVFTKSSLELLPQAPSDSSSHEVSAGENDSTASSDQSDGSSSETPSQAASEQSSIAVFKQRKHAGRKTGLQFEGWFQIQRIAFLEPHSDELVRMLEQKWTRTDREGRATMEERKSRDWQKSLELRWAVVKFVKDAKADRERGVPQIERLTGKQPTSPKKSVNEMLAEMRLEDVAGGSEVVDEPED